MMMAYQPQWRDGQEYGASDRDCAGRYEAIKRELQAARSPLRVLDVGANTGYFSYRLADELDAECIAVDKNRELIERPGVRVLQQYVTRESFPVLATGANVILLLSVLHHMSDWLDVLTDAINRASVVFVEIPSVHEELPNARTHNQTITMHGLIQEHMGIVIAWTPGYDKRYDRPLYAIGKIS